MKCQNCGNDLEPTAQFCGNCGNPVAATAPVTAPVAQPTTEQPDAPVTPAAPQAPTQQPIAAATSATEVAKAMKSKKIAAIVGIIAGVVAAIASTLYFSDSPEVAVEDVDPVVGGAIMLGVGLAYLVLSILLLKAATPQKALRFLYGLAGLTGSILLLSLLGGGGAGLIYVLMAVALSFAIRNCRVVKG